METTAKTRRSFEFVLLLLLGFLWGIPYALNKISLATVPPVTLTAARVAVAAAVLWIIVGMAGSRLPPPEAILRLFFQGCIACVVPYTFIAFGQQTVPSALASILNSAGPLFVCLLSLVWTRDEPTSPGRLGGVAIGLSGVVLITGNGALGNFGHTTVGQIAIILATLSSAVGAIHGRRFSSIAPEVTAAATLTSAAIVLAPLSFMLEAPLSCRPSTASIIAMLVNAVMATALGFVIYFRLIRTIGSLATTSVGYLRPAVGVVIGCLLLGEHLSWTITLGLTVILIGIATINFNPAPVLFSQLLGSAKRRLFGAGTMLRNY